MKRFFILSIICIAAMTVYGQHSGIAGIKESNKKTLLVDASCGECKFGMKGETCDLAVRINGKAYFVDGVHIDSLGDAHASDGFCKTIRKASVQGEIVNNRFKATYFQLVDNPAKKP